ncbi:MAG: YebC/PmpR family DNA-binding transcriptional regulator [Anaerolineaceae bacterium]|nr:MAG: YebC/PmpR family DNA-binding transcriptional regulator [Anaerolineaceae bacterium]
MSGHSKWSTIKRKKGAEDAKRGKIFTRLARDIMVAAREGGGDEATNSRLKLAIGKAKQANMPKDNIERAIKKGTGELDGGQLDELTYEAYGIDGVAFIIEILTDNKNRALADTKHILNKHGGNLASNGAVSWQFDMKGYIVLKDDGLDFEEVFMVAAEAGAEDVTQEEDRIVVYTPREQYGAVVQSMEEGGYNVEESELRWEPQNETQVSVDSALKNMRIIEKLEELDDVQSVSSNLMITDEIASAFEAV